MARFENLTANQKLRATLHGDARAICTETCHLLGLDISKTAIEVIAELVYKKLSIYGTDLETFAKHAKRQTINADDVKVLVRRNPSLIELISKKIESNPSILREKRRKTGNKSAETPTKDGSLQKEKNETESPANKKTELKDKSNDNAVNIDMVEDVVLVNNECENMTIDLTFD